MLSLASQSRLSFRIVMHDTVPSPESGPTDRDL